MDVYWEKQRLFYCAVHTINALVQEKSCSVKELDEVCLELCPNRQILNPHRNFLRLGSFDANVVEIALHRRGLTTKWHHADREVTSEELTGESFVGVILNEKHGWFGRHWYCIRLLRGKYMTIDSAKDKPTSSTLVEAVKYLEEERGKGVHIIFVHKEQAPSVAALSS